MHQNINYDWSYLPPLLRVQEMRKILGIGKNRAYELCHSKGFPVIIIGKSLKVSRDGLKDRLNNNQGGYTL